MLRLLMLARGVSFSQPSMVSVQSHTCSPVGYMQVGFLLPSMRNSGLAAVSLSICQVVSLGVADGTSLGSALTQCSTRKI
eukprot:5327187-Pleurochrysis_carterae.AAC.1